MSAPYGPAGEPPAGSGPETAESVVGAEPAAGAEPVAGVELEAGGMAPEVVTTGHPAVDAALHAIANAADLPPQDQIAQYEAAHRTLQETLATIDES